ncbi:MAG: class I SAM-dependent methyltransferase [Calditrichota bacterium]
MTRGKESGEWYQQWFDEDYLALYAHRDEAEARQFVNVLWSALELYPGVRVADVPCGAGRHSQAFAARQAQVVGMDLSPAMLNRAQENLDKDQRSPWFVRGDIRQIPLAGGFHVVTNIFTSIGYFKDEADNQKAFAELGRLLAPGGVLVLDVVNPDYLREHFVAETFQRTCDIEVSELRELNLETKRVYKQIRIQHGGAMRMIHESVRLYSREELVKITGENGLTPMGFWGDYDGTEFEFDSPRLILFAKKPNDNRG